MKNIGHLISANERNSNYLIDLLRDTLIQTKQTEKEMFM